MDLATILLANMVSFLWPFFRIGALFMVMAVTGSKLVPVRVRLILAVAVTAVVFQHIPTYFIITELSLTLALTIAKEVLIGMALGFTTLLLAQVFVVSGQLVAMQAGLGFAMMNDPQNGVEVPAVSQFYMLLVTLIFLAINGHLILIEVLVQSFDLLPIGGNALAFDSFGHLAFAGKMIFTGALMMALPAVIALLIVNIAFGVMTRAAPQLNIMTVGFPIMICIGLLVIYLTLPLVEWHFNHLFVKVVALCWQFLGVGA